MTLVLLDRPALGAYLSHPETEERRDRARWMLHMSRIDYSSRVNAVRNLSKAFDGLRTGRRLDLIAADLRNIADTLDEVPQLLLGGWPIYLWLLETT